MSQQLSVLFLEGNQQKQIGILAGDRVAIGRESPEGIAVDVAGVSRFHGEFLRVRSQFVYCDLGSTNGSWVNGKRVEPSRPVVLRSGDTLQIAAAPLKIGANGGLRSEVPSLLVTRVQPSVGAEPPSSLVSIEEFPIPATGVVMTLGGSQSDVEGCADAVAARVLKEDGGLVLEVLSELALLNGLQPSVPRVPIGDNDVISVGDVRIVINIPPRISSTSVRAGSVFGTSVSSQGKSERPSPILDRDAGDVERTVRIASDEVDSHINPEATTAVFDSRIISDSRMRAGNASNLATGDVHPSRRFGENLEQAPNTFGLSPLEVKLVIVMAIMLFASVFLLGLWWFSQNQ